MNENILQGLKFESAPCIKLLAVSQYALFSDLASLCFRSTSSSTVEFSFNSQKRPEDAWKCPDVFLISRMLWANSKRKWASLCPTPFERQSPWSVFFEGCRALPSCKRLELPWTYLVPFANRLRKAPFVKGLSCSLSFGTPPTNGVPFPKCPSRAQNSHLEFPHGVQIWENRAVRNPRRRCGRLAGVRKPVSFKLALANTWWVFKLKHL